MRKAVVIGAGVIGTSVAYHLCHAGLAVELLDAGRPGGGTSNASFAWLNARHRTPEHYFRLSHLAMAYHRELQERLGRRWQHGAGCVEWAVTEHGRRDLLAAVERLRGWGYPARVLPIDEVRGSIEPNLRVGEDDVPWAAWFPDDTAVHPAVMISAMLSQVETHGGRVRAFTRSTGVEIEGGAVGSVLTASGERIPADVVVNCAGPSSREPGSWMGIDLPMGTRPGLILVTEPAPTWVRGVIRTPGLELRSDGGGRVLINALFAEGSLEATGPPPIDGSVCQEALVRARRLVAGLDGVGLEAVRVGVRPMPDDGLPLVGPVPEVAGAYVVVTHSGVSLAPLLGRLVAAEIAEGSERGELGPFRPDRRIAR